MMTTEIKSPLPAPFILDLTKKYLFLLNTMDGYAFKSINKEGEVISDTGPETVEKFKTTLVGLGFKSEDIGVITSEGIDCKIIEVSSAPY